MNMGWNNKNICMHCMMQLNQYIQFPYQLGNLPRRSMQSFVANLKPAPNGEKCDLQKLMHEEFVLLIISFRVS